MGADPQGRAIKPCLFKHDGPITTLYGVPPQEVKGLPQTCSVCGEALQYAEIVYFVSEPHQREYTDDESNVVMTCEPLS